MPLNFSAAAAVLKDVYLPVIREQLNQSNWLLQNIEQRTSQEDFEGAAAIFSAHVGRNSGIGARADSGALPTAGAQSYAKGTVTVKHEYGRLQVSGPTIRAMKSDRGSFTRAVESESKGLVNDLKRDVNRQLYGTSNGVIASTTNGASDTNVELDSTTPASALRQLSEGMVIDIGSIAVPTASASARTVSAVDFTLKSFTISGAAVDTVDAEFVFRSGSGGDGASQKELTGLQTIVAAADDNLFGIDTGVNPVWAATVDTSGGTLTDTLLESVLDTVDIAAGEFPDVIVTTHAVVRSYAAALKDNKRFTNTVELKGGFKAVSIDTPAGHIALMRDRDVPDGFAFVLNLGHLLWFTQSDWSWMDDDGAVLSRVTDYDAYEAVLYKDAELATDKRNSHAKVSGLT